MMFQLIASFAVFGSVFWIVRSVVSMRRSGVEDEGLSPSRIDILSSYYEEKLNDLFIQNPKLRLLAFLHFFRHVIAFVVGIVLLNLVMAFALAIFVHFVPAMVLKALWKRRWDRFDDQIPEAVNMMTSSVRAGLTLVQSLETASLNMPAPSSQEFGLMLKQYEHGQSLIQVLQTARERIPTSNFKIVSTALIVNREKGGNLTEVLEKIGTSIREISRLEKKIKTETSSVRFSSNIMMFMPAVIGVFFYTIEPESIEILFTTLLGNFLLLIIVALNVIAYAAIRKIINVAI